MATCRCDAGSWTTAREPICDNFTPSECGFCSECWHDKACHSSAWSSTWEDEVRRDERQKVMAEIKMRLGL